MTTRRAPVAGRRVLIVEDDYHVASSLAFAFEAAGVGIVGPVATVEEALTVIAAGGRIDGAVLDINLRGQMAYPVADALLEQGVSFVITTGYDEHAVTQRYPGIACFEKPAIGTRLIEALFGAAALDE